MSLEGQTLINAAAEGFNINKFMSIKRKALNNQRLIPDSMEIGKLIEKDEKKLENISN